MRRVFPRICLPASHSRPGLCRQREQFSQRYQRHRTHHPQRQHHTSHSRYITSYFSPHNHSGKHTFINHPASCRFLGTMPPSAREDHVQDDVLRRSLSDPESFWAHQAEHLHWHKKPSRALTTKQRTIAGGQSHTSWEWFSDGHISTCYNCVDRHVHAGRGDNVAIVFDSPVTGVKEKYTYKQLLQEVEVLAGALQEEGVRQGDVVMIYSETLVHMY